MRRPIAWSIAAPTMSLAIAAFLPAGCGREKPPPAGGKIVVVASIFPIADAARQIGGDLVEVHCLLDPGASPHQFSARAAHAELLGKARLLITVGMGLDEWARKAAGAAGGNAGLQTIELTKQPEFLRVYEGGAPRPSTSRPADAAPLGDSASARATPADSAGRPAAHHEDGEDEGRPHHHHDGADPHVWLSPAFMDAFVTIIVDELSRLAPAHAAGVAERGEAFRAQLRALDDEYRQRLARVKSRYFLTYHEAFGYIADRYGLHQMAVDEIGAGAIGAGRLEAVRAFMKDNHVQAIFVEPQYPAEKLEALARQTDARVGRLDPEGNPNNRGYDSYLAMMRSNLNELARCLGEQP